MTLFIPGPVDLLGSIKQAQAADMINHRGAEFRALYGTITEKAKKVFKTNGDVFLITASGTGGIEAALASMLAKNDKMLCVENGVFGKRFGDAAGIYCDGVEPLKFEYGKGADVERVKAAIDGSNATLFGMVYNDTVPGVGNRVEPIVRHAKKKGMLVIIDAVSALAGFPFEMDAWGVDVCITASQKCIAAPPGIALIAASAAATEKIGKNDVRSYYFDLRRYAKYAHEAETPFTPAVSTLFALDVALDVLFAEGLERRIARHAQAGAYVRGELARLGLELFVERGYESNTLTAFKTGDADRIKNELKQKYDYDIAGGYAELKGKMLRIAHLGNFEMKRLESLIAALEDVLHA